MLSKEDYAVIETLKKRGVYLKDIAEELEVHARTVKRALQRGLQSFLSHRQVFEKSVRQTIVVSLKSQWDWFVTKSGEFVIFAQTC